LFQVSAPIFDAIEEISFVSTLNMDGDFVLARTDNGALTSAWKIAGQAGAEHLLANEQT